MNRTDPAREPTTLVDVRDAKQERSVGELMGDLTRDLGTLVRKEIELAKVEIKEEVATRPSRRMCSGPDSR